MKTEDPVNFALHELFKVILVQQVVKCVHHELFRII